MLLLLALLAIDLTGTWTGKREGPGGRSMETSFTFREEGGRLTGSTGTPMGQMPITDIVLNGDDIAFTVRLTLGGEERPMKYSGKVEGDELVLNMQLPAGFPLPPGGGAMPALRVKRMNAEAIAAREAARPKPMALPERRELPANGLALTPPMGWNSYNKFHTDITDAQVREIADALVASGMRDAGYRYLVIDDGWEGERDAQGRLQPNPKFPDMKGLVDYIHSKGLKAGLWTTPGPRACNPNYQGSYGHEKEDAAQWAEWGFDYIKFDWCSAASIYSPEQQPLVYQKQAELLRATGREIVFSICQYGDNRVAEWAAAAGGNLWRTTFDIRDTWESMSSIGFRQTENARFAGPGHWIDPDMLEVGNGGMTAIEYQTHFSLWAMLAAPLMAGNDVRDMSPATKSILLNKEVIAIDQDPLGKAATRVAVDGDTEVWARPLQDGGYAVALFNRGKEPTLIRARFSDFAASGTWQVRDLWHHKDLGPSEDQLAMSVPGHGVGLLRLSR